MYTLVPYTTLFLYQSSGPPWGPETPTPPWHRREAACRNGAGPRRGQRLVSHAVAVVDLTAAMELAPGGARDGNPGADLEETGRRPQWSWPPEIGSAHV